MISSAATLRTGLSVRHKGDQMMFACWVAHDNLRIRQLVELRRFGLETVAHPFDLEYAGDW